MAIDFARLTRANVDAAIIRYAASDRAFDVRPTAVTAVNAFASITPSQIDEATFEGYVLSMAGKLDVAVPAVPADLATLTDAQARTLAGQLELADWDWHRRLASVNENWTYWVRQIALGRAAPSATVYVNMLLRIMNYVRSKRGLAAVT